MGTFTGQHLILTKRDAKLDEVGPKKNGLMLVE